MKVKITRMSNWLDSEIKEFKDYNEMFEYLFSKTSYIHVEKSEGLDSCDFFVGMEDEEDNRVKTYNSDGVLVKSETL